MAESKIEGVNELNDLIANMQKVEDYVNSLNGQKIDLNRTKTFVPGPFLHQDTAAMSEEESAAFERNNKKLFDFIQSTTHEISQMLK